MTQLTSNQQIFADEYMKDRNATRAYMVAYPRVKDAEVAAAASSRLLRNVRVAAYIDKKLEDMSSERIATATEVMETLTRVLRREEKEYTVVTLKRRRSYYDENGKKIIEEREEPEIVEMPTRVTDVNKAADQLGRCMGMYTDKLNVDIKLPVVIAGSDALED